MSQRTGQTRTRALGFSLVEVMVAALIGLIGSVVIFQVYAISEGQKRTTTGGADASQSGLLALYAIEREARMAGYGINYTPLIGCTILAYDGTTARDPITVTPALKMVAIELVDGAAGAADSLRFMYGNSNLVVSPVRLNAASDAGTTLHKVAIRFGFAVGDLTLLGQVGSPGTDCTLQQVTALPTSPGDEVHHTATLRYNKNTITGQPNYPAWSQTNQNGGVLYNLGPSPSVSIYAISGGQLTNQDLLASATASAVMDGIVQLQAEYGKDTDGDGVVDAWNTGEPANATEWSRVVAMRIALVARSAAFDKAHCSANPQWTSDGAVTDFVMRNVEDGLADSYTGSACAPGTVPASPNPNNWRQYRYRVFETVVPLRNHIWFPI